MKVRELFSIAEQDSGGDVQRLEVVDEKLGVRLVWPDPQGKTQFAVFSTGNGRRIAGWSFRCGKLCSTRDFWEREFSRLLETIRSMGLSAWERKVGGVD